MLRPTISPDDQLLSLPEVAKALGVTPPTARTWILAGRLPAREVGSGGRIVIVVRRQDLDAFVANRRLVPSAAADPVTPRDRTNSKGARRS